MRTRFGLGWARSGKLSGVALAAAGIFVLAGCASASQPGDSSTPSDPADPRIVSEPPLDPGATESPAATGERRVEFTVTGDAGTALIRHVVVRADTDENADATMQALPWSATDTLRAEDSTDFHKLVLFAKNVDGASGSLTCEIRIDGEIVATQHTTGYQPVTCLYLAR
ncbi:hypothetical protein M2390_001436 [Mycetocola sp. BIGb0189]|uniref:hypothetical protein n=1 Tax=Mycetocola sp. BIGb0189 TaxID=2940604 RepID=UPI0021684DC7|nr:hypothetical protein [Mycetocola sp. BIGb0189]MCS4276254.1 hypothetical protein [Mycetocola sp. BIGb0189]